MARMGEPVLHLEYQGSAPSHYTGIVPITVQEVECLLQADRAMVLEVNHWACSCTVRAALITDSRIP